MAALDFDLACSLRLEIYESELRKNQAKLIAYEVGKLFSGGEEASAADTEAQIW